MPFRAAIIPQTVAGDLAFLTVLYAWLHRTGRSAHIATELMTTREVPDDAKVAFYLLSSGKFLKTYIGQF
jgi:hypothetical protein